MEYKEIVLTIHLYTSMNSQVLDEENKDFLTRRDRFLHNEKFVRANVTSI